MGQVTSGQPTRQPGDVVEQMLDARDKARDRRDDADRAHDLAAHLLVQAVLGDFEVPEDWKDRYRVTEKALADAREAFQAARVAWYHSMGKHASKNLALCCEPEAG